MNYDKLIETLRQHGVSCVRAHGRYCSICDEAATALSTLQAENSRLRAELEYEREHANAYHEECGQWEAENEKLRAELERVRYEKDKAIETLSDNLRAAYQSRDAAIKDLNTLRKQSGWRCFACYFNDHYERSICIGCDYNDGNNWKWRGQKKD